MLTLALEVMALALGVMSLPLALASEVVALALVLALTLLALTPSLRIARCSEITPGRGVTILLVQHKRHLWKRWRGFCTGRVDNRNAN